MDITEEADIFVEGLQQQELITVLKKAEHAHHFYEQVNLHGKRDEEWAAWYAKYIKENVGGSLFGDLDEYTIQQALEHATRAQVFHKDYTWEEFAASYIVHYVLNPSYGPQAKI